MDGWGVTRPPPFELSFHGHMGGVSVNGLLLKLAMAATVGCLFASTPSLAQLVPPVKKAERVEIINGPSLEGARSDLAIIRWTTNNPGEPEPIP